MTMLIATLTWVPIGLAAAGAPGGAARTVEEGPT
jgi:hypothetical protein